MRPTIRLMSRNPIVLNSLMLHLRAGVGIATINRLIVAIPTPARKWSIRLFKTIGFLLISLMVGRTLEPAEFYLNHDVASSICDFIYGDTYMCHRVFQH